MKKIISAFVIIVSLITLTVPLFATSSASYDIEIVAEYGAKVDVYRPQYSDIVVVSVSLDDGYELKEFAVHEKESGKVVPYTEASDYDFLCSFTMPEADVEITVTVNELQSHKIILESSMDGEALTSSHETARIGEKVRITCKPPADYVPRYVKYEFDGSTRTASLTKSGDVYTFDFTMPNYDVAVMVVYRKAGKLYSLKVASDSKGVITLDDYSYVKGETVTITDNPDDDKTVIDVWAVFSQYGYEAYLDADKNEDGTFTFEMPELGGTVYAEWTDGTHKISSNYNVTFGRVKLSVQTAKKGDTVHFYVEPKAGYEIDRINIQSENTTGRIDYEYDKILDRYSFVMVDEPVICDVDFRKSSSKVNSAADVIYNNEFGTVELSNTAPQKGQKLYIYAEPVKGAVLESIKVKSRTTGETVYLSKDDEGYYFAMPEGEVTVFVEFAEKYEGAVEYYKNKEKEKETEKEETKEQPKEETRPVTDKAETTPEETIAPTEVEKEPEIHICPAKAYSDVDTSKWYHKAVDYVISAGLMGGYSEHTFGPHDTTTRAMIATVLWRMEGSPAPITANPFSDVPTATWYTDAVVWAAEKGIVNGIGGGMFNPDGEITREQLAAMVHRYVMAKGVILSGDPPIVACPDMGDTSDWAKEAVTWCYNNSIIYIRDGKLLPGAPAERAEIAYAMFKISVTE